MRVHVRVIAWGSSCGCVDGIIWIRKAILPPVRPLARSRIGSANIATHCQLDFLKCSSGNVWCFHKFQDFLRIPLQSCCGSEDVMTGEEKGVVGCSTFL